MIQRLFLYESPSVDPYWNLAVEQHLLETVAPDSVILYLWQNRNTVVIGKNQNPWKECKTTLLSEEGGNLARRLSGGGAVFHDLGNLNFTFLLPQSQYNLDRQFQVIMEAVGSFGVEVERSGRNDVLAGGRKFSGNAFYKNGAQAYHHGTLLVDADKEKMARYLNPSKRKLQAKGVDSVRSRVMNLRELIPELTIDALKSAMAQAFGKVYGLPVQKLTQLPDEERIRVLAQRNASWDWNFGAKLPLRFQCEDRFPWGGVTLELDVEGGIIAAIRVYTDAMDWTLSGRVEQALKGVRLERSALMDALRDIPEGEEICCLLCQSEEA